MHWHVLFSVWNAFPSHAHLASSCHSLYLSLRVNVPKLFLVSQTELGTLLFTLSQYFFLFLSQGLLYSKYSNLSLISFSFLKNNFYHFLSLTYQFTTSFFFKTLSHSLHCFLQLFIFFMLNTFTWYLLSIVLRHIVNAHPPPTHMFVSVYGMLILHFESFILINLLQILFSVLPFFFIVIISSNLVILVYEVVFSWNYLSTTLAMCIGERVS